MSFRFPFSRATALCSFAVAAGALYSAPAAHAQRYLGTIQGSITDPTGANIPGATVTAENVQTHFKTSATANAGGAYTLAGLNPGTYTVTVTAPGFGTVSRTDVLLTAGQLQQVDVPLNAGGVSEVVEVSSDNSLLDSGSAQIATTLSTQEVTDLPNVGRNPFVLATLAAGVLNTGSGGYFQGKSSQFTQPFSGVAVQITSDGSGGHNRLTLDGIPDDPPERLSGASYTGFVPSPEAVQEVKVQTSIFDAQIGHGNGTVTNTVVRNGTNTLHGAAYYVFQNTYLNANTYEKVPNQNNPNPSLRTPRNNDQVSQTGFVLDGPVVIPKLYNGKDKTFFMVAFERYNSHTAINYSARVPTAAERAGDFSALCSAFNSAGFCTNGVQLYDPLSPVTAAGTRTVFFPNNNISSRINSTGAALLNYLPLPNVPGAAITGTNYISTQTSYHSSNPALIFRLDQTLGAKDKLNAIYFRNGLAQAYPLQGFPQGIGPGGYGYSVYRRNHGGSVDEVHQFSSSLILDSRFGLIFHPFGLVYPGNQGFNLSTLNIAGTYPYNSFPGTSESDGYASLAAGAGGQISESTNGSLEEVLTKSLGRHNLRIGFEGNLLRYNVQNPQSGFGTLSFDRRFTQSNSISYGAGGTGDNSGDSIADELLGYSSSTSYNINIASALQQIYAAPFVQDDWRVNNKLTLNLGVRYDYESPFTERYNRQVAGFNATATNPIQASVSGLATPGGLTFTSGSNRFAYPRDLNNVQPRIGGAFQATQYTVFRAGYGIIYFNTLESPITTGFSQTSSYNNYTNSAPLYSISNPFPAGVTLPTGSSLGLSTAVGQGISFYDPHHVTPKSTQFSASVQQQFPGNLALQIAYVGSRPTQLEVNHNINTIPQQYINQGGPGQVYLQTQVANPLAGKIPGTSGLNAATLQRYLTLLPYPEFGTVTEVGSSIGSAPYNALQVQVNKQMRHHFSFQGNFTWDKLILRNGFFTGSASSVVAQNLYSVQDTNPTLFGNIFGVFELPLLLHRPAYERLALGGWQLNGVVRMENGPQVSAPGGVDIIGPLTTQGFSRYREFNTCYNTYALNTTTGAVSYTPVASKSGVVACDAQSPVPGFQQRLNFTLQTNSGVLPVREPIHPQIDFSLFKKFTIREGTNFEIRGEFFNVFNTPNFGGPNTSLGQANTGSACSSSGVCSQANDPRIGQLTARINF